jgi:hypothetical protein
MWPSIFRAVVGGLVVRIYSGVERVGLRPTFRNGVPAEAGATPGPVTNQRKPALPKTTRRLGHTRLSVRFCFALEQGDTARGVRFRVCVSQADGSGRGRVQSCGSGRGR